MSAGTPEQRAAMAREELFAAAATILARPREQG